MRQPLLELHVTVREIYLGSLEILKKLMKKMEVL